MPADQLATTPAAASAASVHGLVPAVRSALAGTPLDEAAARHDLAAAELAHAIELYHDAGALALRDRQAGARWWQAHLEFSDWECAECTAAMQLEPRLRSWATDGLLDRWWFIRKAPCWRLRIRPAAAHHEFAAIAATDLDSLVRNGHLSEWRSTHYEPESLAFGGPAGIDVAHDLFSADSAHLLTYVRSGRQTLGRRELSLLLCTALFRAAGQEWFEEGDIWHRVTDLRPHRDHTSTDPHHHAALCRQLGTLLRYDTRPTGPLFGTDGPLATIRPWAEAFHDAGRALARAAEQASLRRGLRAILAHHVIFHWNRLGLDAATQHALAHAATTANLQRQRPL